MSRAIQSRFMALLEEEKLADSSQILSLDDFDEPPLFSRNDQVEFLRPLTQEQPMVAGQHVRVADGRQHPPNKARRASRRQATKLTSTTSFRNPKEAMDRPTTGKFCAATATVLFP